MVLAGEPVTAGMMNMAGGDAPGMRMSASEAPGMDLNDVDFDAFLANDRTLSDPEDVAAHHAAHGETGAACGV
jgi:hypothetical protein